MLQKHLAVFNEQQTLCANNVQSQGLFPCSAWDAGKRYEFLNSRIGRLNSILLVNRIHQSLGLTPQVAFIDDAGNDVFVSPIQNLIQSRNAGNPRHEPIAGHLIPQDQKSRKPNMYSMRPKEQVPPIPEKSKKPFWLVHLKT